MSPGACFEALDSLDRLTSLTKRTPTLDGAVPVRVARACVPLLEGNAFGWQVSLSRPLLVRRRLGRWTAEWEDDDGGTVLNALHQKRLARLVATGRVTAAGPWYRRLHGPVVRSKGRTLQLFTGLLLRPDAGTWLRVSNAANRRNTSFEVVEQVVIDEGTFVPLVLELRLSRDAPAAFRIVGELATVAALQPGVRFQESVIADAPELARAHAAFYDRGYFEAKKEDVTGRYRHRLATEIATDEEGLGTAECRAVSVGPARFEREALGGFVSARGAIAADPKGRLLDTMVFRNEIAFKVLFDGHTLALDYDPKVLAAKARRVERALAEALGGPSEHPGAGLYLSKYFTPHPPGEPHFFVKPWAFTQTPPGWSCLLDGIHGDGYDVMRGVVSTDVFHATPAVFQVRRVGAAIRVQEGAPLLRVIPVPRRLLGAGFRFLGLD